MKAIIKIVTAKKEFTPDQLQIIRRVTNVLSMHSLSVDIRIDEKKTKIKPLRLKVV